MKKIDKISKTSNIVLGVLYIPLSLISWLLQMVSESTMDATNPLYIGLIDTFCVVAFVIPLLCITGIVLSKVLREKGHSIWSFVIQFIPLIVFVVNLLLLVFAESVPPRI